MKEVVRCGKCGRRNNSACVSPNPLFNDLPTNLQDLLKPLLLHQNALWGDLGVVIGEYGVARICSRMLGKRTVGVLQVNLCVD